MKKAYIFIAIIVIAACVFLFCSLTGSHPAGGNIVPVQCIKPKASQIKAPTGLPAPEVLSLDAVADPSVDASDIENPYGDINKYAAQLYNPDKVLYNVLFRAVVKMKKSVDVTYFKLSYRKKYNTAASLLYENGFRLFYLKSCKISGDGKTIKFTYYDMGSDEIEKDSALLDARLSHLLYNVAPEGGCDLQRFAALYQYVCRISDYASDTDDPQNTTPYGVLVKGQGICSGYAQLMQYALTKLGIEADYVCNDKHAWNIVSLGGEWYDSDVTWGAGSSLSPDNVNFMLMDDTARKKSLTQQGCDTGKEIVGFPRKGAQTPPACTDTRFNVYGSFGFCYAFDIENNKVYFCDSEGIGSMNLDCTGRQTLAAGESCNQMVFFNGALYYISSNNGCLSRLVPEGKPEILDSSGTFVYITLSGTKLSYGPSMAAAVKKTIDLLPLPEETKDADITKYKSVPRSRSFCVQIRFSKPMDKAQNWNECVYLASDTGDVIPCGFSYDAITNTLTVRPKNCVDDYSSVTLYITGAAAAQDGAKLGRCAGIRVNIV